MKFVDEYEVADDWKENLQAGPFMTDEAAVNIRVKHEGFSLRHLEHALRFSTPVDLGATLTHPIANSDVN